VTVDELRERALDMIEPPSRRYLSQRTLSRLAIWLSAAALLASCVAIALSI